jgi:hypothetical protein
MVPSPLDTIEQVKHGTWQQARSPIRQLLDVSGAFRIEWTALAAIELDQLHAFDRPPIRRAVDVLEHQALTETINRKPLRERLLALPDATWEVRVGRHRVLYRVDGGTARILRVILKAGTTGESL